MTQENTRSIDRTEIKERHQARGSPDYPFMYFPSISAGAESSLASLSLTDIITNSGSNYLDIAKLIEEARAEEDERVRRESTETNKIPSYVFVYKQNESSEVAVKVYLDNDVKDVYDLLQLCRDKIYKDDETILPKYLQLVTSGGQALNKQDLIEELGWNYKTTLMLRNNTPPNGSPCTIL